MTRTAHVSRQCEIQSSYVTKAKFSAACRAALRKNNLEAWVGHITRDIAEKDGLVTRSPATAEKPYHELVSEGLGYVQYYFRPTAEGRAQGYTGYNFIYDFTWDTETEGHGYLYVSEF